MTEKDLTPPWDTEQGQKEQELARLHDIVFEGAPDWAKWAAHDNPGLVGDDIRRLVCHWTWHEEKPEVFQAEFYRKNWHSTMSLMSCKNQPETDLPWTDTLIERKQ